MSIVAQRKDREQIMSEELDTLTIPMEDFFETSIAQYDEFDENAWKKGEGYICPNFPMFNKYMEGLEAGLYMFAGESNMGKSGVALNLFWDYCMYENNKLFGIFFSLDDSKEEIIPRIIAMNEEIPISAVSKPQRLQNKIDLGDPNTGEYETWLEKRANGIQFLKDNRNKFKIEDGERIQCGEQILDYCKKAQLFVKAHDPDANIIVCIDSLSDITFASQSFKSDKELNDYIAKQVKRWAVEILKVPIFGTLHLRKIEQNRRPTIADVKDSGRYAYEASTLFLVHNDVSRNKASAGIYTVAEDTQEKIPVIELDWAKNKKSSFKGVTYHSFFTNYSKVIECDEAIMERFNRIRFTT